MMPMPHRADLYRPDIEQATAQQISGYTRITRGVACFIQPMDSKEALYYGERGTEDMATIYTTRTDLTIKRNDILEDTTGNQYHVVGVKNGLMRNLYLEIAVNNYPEEAKKRLNREEYD